MHEILWAFSPVQVAPLCFSLLGWKALVLPARSLAPLVWQRATAGCKTHLPPGLGIKPSSNPILFDTQPIYITSIHISSSTLSFCPTTSFERWCSIPIRCCCWSVLNKQSNPLTTTSQKTTKKRALWLLPHFLPLCGFRNNIGEILTSLKSVAKLLLNLTGPEFYNFCWWLKFLCFARP